jgi:hypothetical protein
LVIVGAVILLAGLTAALVAIITSLKAGNRPVKPAERAALDANPTADIADDLTADDICEELEERGDFLVLVGNVTYAVGVNAQLLPAHYIFRAAVEGATTFALRHNGETAVYTDDTDINLKEGDTICAVGNAVLVRAA